MSFRSKNTNSMNQQNISPFLQQRTLTTTDMNLSRQFYVQPLLLTNIGNYDKQSRKQTTQSESEHLLFNSQFNDNQLSNQELELKPLRIRSANQNKKSVYNDPFTKVNQQIQLKVQSRMENISQITLVDDQISILQQIKQIIENMNYYQHNKFQPSFLQQADQNTFALLQQRRLKVVNEILEKLENVKLAEQGLVVEGRLTAVGRKRQEYCDLGDKYVEKQEKYERHLEVQANINYIVHNIAQRGPKLISEYKRLNITSPEDMTLVQREQMNRKIASLFDEQLTETKLQSLNQRETGKLSLQKSARIQDQQSSLFLH